MSALDDIDQVLSDAPEVEADRDKLEQITDLLTGKTELPEGATAEELIGDDETEVKQETAEESGAEDENLHGVDYDAEIPLSDGSKIKLGELKDHYQSAQKHRLDVIERENAVMARMNELSELAQHVQLPPQQVAMIKQQQEQYLMTEHQRMLEAIPEFREQAAFTAARNAIQDMAAEYGIQDQVAQITDHRIVKMLHDYARLRGQIKAAKENVKPLRSSEPVAKQKAAGKPDMAALMANKAKQTRNRGDQLAAINALLK
jgi:hypothetical protein